MAPKDINVSASHISSVHHPFSSATVLTVNRDSDIAKAKTSDTTFAGNLFIKHPPLQYVWLFCSDKSTFIGYRSKLRIATVCFYNSPPSFRASIHNSNNFYTIFLYQTLARTFLRTFCSFCVFSLREFTCLRHEQCWLAGGRFFPCWRLSNSN